MRRRRRWAYHQYNPGWDAVSAKGKKGNFKRLVQRCSPKRRAGCLWTNGIDGLAIYMDSVGLFRPLCSTFLFVWPRNVYWGNEVPQFLRLAWQQEGEKSIESFILEYTFRKTSTSKSMLIREMCKNRQQQGRSWCAP